MIYLQIENIITHVFVSKSLPLRHNQPRILRLLIRIARQQIPVYRLIIRAVQVLTERMQLLHYLDIRLRILLPTQLAQRQQIIQPEHCRHDDPALVRMHQLRIHHHTRHSPIPIVERMHLADHKHHEYRSGHRILQRLIPLKTIFGILGHLGLTSLIHCKDTEIFANKQIKSLLLLKFSQIFLGFTKIYAITQFLLRFFLISQIVFPSSYPHVASIYDVNTGGTSGKYRNSVLTDNEYF